MLLASLLVACNAQNKGGQQQSHQNAAHQDGDHEYTNELINETSPYLLQHAHNPVNWNPWGDQSLAKAEKEDKLMIISVGYAACHWCHVMEHESFEDTTVAQIMNDNFVPIKVDREERPDVDQIYMDACHLLNQRGGWPLNAIALPDGRPVFAGTYYQKDQWLKILEFFKKEYQVNKEELISQAEKITQGIISADMIQPATTEVDYRKADLDGAFQPWYKNMDMTLGGKTGQPKFPMPNNYLFLLRYHHLTGNKNALKAVEVSLDNMAFGGIYDHVGGGFARYSVDSRWHVPHFEKMLYDNGQLVSLYSEAYQLTKKPLYKEAVYETLEFIERELMDQSGGFYSSLDADSEGEEGKFYVWQQEDVVDLLGEDAILINEYFNITEKGNWEEHKNVLFRKKTDEQFAKKYGLKLEDIKSKVKDAKAKMLEERTKRIRPGLDDKILTSWNALMLKGYVDAYRVFGEEAFLQKAITNANFIVKNCFKKDNSLYRNYKNGESSINAFLDDYALTAEAFISLYQATFDEKWLAKARDLTEYSLAHFYDEESKMFFYTSDVDAPLITRKKEVSDNVIPSSNSSMAKVLYLLSKYYYNEDYLNRSKQMLANVQAKVKQQARFYSNWAYLMYYMVNEPYEVAIVGDDFKKIRQDLDQHYLPQAILLGGKNEGSMELLKNKLIEGQTTVYVCQNKVCKLPVTEANKALDLMK